MLITILQLLSAISGLVGTILIYLNSYTIESSPTAQCGDAELETIVNENNNMRIYKQKIGIRFIGTSVTLLIISSLLELCLGR